MTRLGLSTRRANRAGFSLVELLVALTLTLVITIGVLRTLRGTLVFKDRADRNIQAREAARGSMTVIETDLQSVLVSTSGVSAIESATTTAIVVRAPLATGMLCATSGTTATVSLLPVDSLLYASSTTAGVAYQSVGGNWAFVPGATVSGPGTAVTCAAAGVNVTTLGAGVGGATSPAGRIVTLAAAIPAGTAPGTLVTLYHRISYEFAASTLHSGRIALWRRTLGVAGSTPVSSVEIATPLANSASFRFFTGTLRASVPAVPPSLASIVGLELVLPGLSNSASRETSSLEETVVRSSIFFRNRLD